MTKKTRFRIQKMDCPSEEQLIRMTLADDLTIQHLEFDIPQRELTVFHQGSDQELLKRLLPLKFDTSLLNTEDVASVEVIDNSSAEKKLLWQVFLINFFFFVLESLAGWWANSMGLVSDSLDMLADSLVYALALFAVGGTLIRKKRIAKAAGIFQLVLALLGFAEVLKRFLGMEPVPMYSTMIVISFLALIGNSICLVLLQKSKSKEAHMQASVIFTSNDVIINSGVIFAGLLVYALESKTPDLIVGSIIFVVVARGAFKILSLGSGKI